MTEQLEGFIGAVAEAVFMRVEEKFKAKYGQPPADAPLEDTLSHMLENAEWFRNMVAKHIDDQDFTKEIRRAVDAHDFDDAADAAVDKALDDFDFDPKIKDYIERCVKVSIEVK